MPEVVKHAPPAPPVTYDIIGLTYDEAVALRDLTAQVARTHFHDLHQGLVEALGYGKRWIVTSLRGDSGGVTLRLNDLGDEAY